MNALMPAARDIRAVKVTEIPNGEGFRKLSLAWLDGAGAPQTHHFHGLSAQKVHADLASCTAVSEEARRAYLLGLIRGKTSG